MWKFKCVIYCVCLLTFLSVSAQKYDFVSYINSLKILKVQNKINNIKQDLFSKNIDTSNIIFIPVFNSNLCIKNLNDEYTYFNNTLNSKQFLSEILFIRKLDKKVIGSNYFSKDGSGYTYFYESNYHYIGIMPCRKEDRLTWLTKNYYRSIKKLLKKQEHIGIFVTISNIGGLIYIKDNGEVEIICP